MKRRSTNFDTRIHWRDSGALELKLKTSSDRARSSVKIGAHTPVKLQPGRWVEIEQEVVLNTPGKADGLLRVWVDGKLGLERKRLNFRSKSSDGFKGILANIHFATRELGWAPSPKNTSLKISPFFVRLN